MCLLVWGHARQHTEKGTPLGPHLVRVQVRFVYTHVYPEQSVHVSGTNIMGLFEVYSVHVSVSDHHGCRRYLVPISAPRGISYLNHIGPIFSYKISQSAAVDILE